MFSFTCWHCCALCFVFCDEVGWESPAEQDIKSIVYFSIFSLWIFKIHGIQFEIKFLSFSSTFSARCCSCQLNFALRGLNFDMNARQKKCCVFLFFIFIFEVGQQRGFSIQFRSFKLFIVYLGDFCMAIFLLFSFVVISTKEMKLKIQPLTKL